MRYLKRLVLAGFVLLWLAGFLLIAPSPLYRLLFLQANQQPLDTPYQLFEGLDWAQPQYYADLGRAFRALSQQATTETIYLYLDPESNIHTAAYRRYFSEYAMVWAYPHVIEQVGTLANVPDGATVMISSTSVPNFECQIGEENLFLCQF
jgi:hypothetical protein